jgi:hypothetical protein
MCAAAFIESRALELRLTTELHADTTSFRDAGQQTPGITIRSYKHMQISFFLI